MEISDLDSTSDSDDEIKLLRKGRKLRRSGRGKDDDFGYNEDMSTEGYSRSDCFKVEKHLLVYGYVFSTWFLCVHQRLTLTGASCFRKSLNAGKNCQAI